MEVSQFTYFQQVGGFDCEPVSGELTYGLERLAMYVQGVDNVYDLDFNGARGRDRSPMATSSCRPSRNTPRYNFEHADTAMLLAHFGDAEAECKALLAGETASAISWCCRPTTSAIKACTSSICSTPAASSA